MQIACSSNKFPIHYSNTDLDHVHMLIFYKNLAYFCRWRRWHTLQYNLQRNTCIFITRCEDIIHIRWNIDKSFYLKSHSRCVFDPEAVTMKRLLESNYIGEDYLLVLWRHQDHIAGGMMVHDLESDVTRLKFDFHVCYYSIQLTQKPL